MLICLYVLGWALCEINDYLYVYLLCLMIRNALVRLVIGVWLILGFGGTEGYFGNFGILVSSGTQLRKLEIFYSN